MKIFKVTFIEWVNEQLYSNGEQNKLTKNVIAESQMQAAEKLRRNVSLPIEIVTIALVGPINIE